MGTAELNRELDTYAPPHTTVYLAEDDSSTRRLIAEALRHDGHLVVEVADGAALLDLVGESFRPNAHVPAPDVIVTDLAMPFLDGTHVLASLRGIKGTCPVVVVTASDDANTYADAARLGATAFFQKPFNVKHLRKVVCRLAGDSRCE